jgi:PhoPQ-activated pathogenicity-related protein
MIRSLTAVSLLVAVACPARADLLGYVRKPDSSFRWSLKEKVSAPSGTSYVLELTSQTWEGIKWEHGLLVYLPDGVKPTDTVFLWNEGGRPDPIRSIFAFELARRAQVPVAFLGGIPNQPLFDGKKEDALIAETFVRYLKTGDEDWPLLFPMAKSLVRAMDALQAFAKDEWKTEVKSFVVSGGSKRGWTSWMTAVSDKRVKAIAPCVIDTLNFGKQLPQQVLSFGRPSEMIRDYTERGLVPIPDTPAARKLWAMVDPWMYRDQLTLPKLLIHGTNDPYWPQDATNLYWDDLKGDKWLEYVPNAGHGLEQVYADGHKDRLRAISTLAAYARAEVRNEPMPKVSWKHEDAGERMKVTVTADPAPKAARLWVADNPTRDFRKARWLERPATLDKGQVTGEVERPAEGWRTFFAECEFETKGGQTFYLTTQLRMAEAGKK